MAGADYYHLIEMTQELLVDMITRIRGDTKVEWMGNELDFTLPFKQVDMMDELQLEVRKKLGDENFILPDLNSENEKVVFAMQSKFKKSAATAALLLAKNFVLNKDTD